jgi:thiol-disulfide isomerase/thioredoxin
MKFKNAFKSNLPFLLILCAFFIFKAPQFFYHLGLSETLVSSEIRTDIKTKSKISFPLQSGPVLIIYWASWCVPCKLEMNRLKNSVETGRIPQSRIYAVNMYESSKKITDFIKTSDFPFNFITKGEAEEKFKIEATPTTVIIINGKISSVSQGMSLVGIWKAEYIFWNFNLQ